MSELLTKMGTVAHKAL